MLTIQDYIETHWQRDGAGKAITDYLFDNMTPKNVINIYGSHREKTPVDGKPLIIVRKLSHHTKPVGSEPVPCIKAVLYSPDTDALIFTVDEVSILLGRIGVPVYDEYIAFSNNVKVSPRYYGGYSSVNMAYMLLYLDIQDSQLPEPA